MAKKANGAGYVASGYSGHQIDGVRKFDHVRIVEAILGRALVDEVVHHVDEDRSNNANSNLVVCPDRAYHNLIHARMNAFVASGHYDWRRCRFCKRYDSQENLRLRPNRNSYLVEHVQCHKDYSRIRARLVRSKTYTRGPYKRKNI